MTITLEDANGRVLAEITPGEGQRVRMICDAEVSHADPALLWRLNRTRAEVIPPGAYIIED